LFISKLPFYYVFTLSTQNHPPTCGGMKMFKLNRNEKTNNFIFAAGYLIFFASLYLGLPQTVETWISLIFAYLGATIYGFISKNPIKSYLFGFLVWPSIIVLVSIYSFITSSVTLFQYISANEFIWYLSFSVIGGVPGYFAAQRNSDKLKTAFHILFIVFFITLHFSLSLSMRVW